MGWFTHHIHTHLKASWILARVAASQNPAFRSLKSWLRWLCFLAVWSALGSMQITAIKLNAGAHITTQMATLGQEQMEKTARLTLYSPGSAGQRRSCGARDDILRVVSP